MFNSWFHLLHNACMQWFCNLKSDCHWQIGNCCVMMRVGRRKAGMCAWEPIPIKACASQLCGAKTPGICRTDCWKISRADLRVGYSSVQQQRHRCGCKCLGRTSLPPTLPPYPPSPSSKSKVRPYSDSTNHAACELWEYIGVLHCSRSF